MPSYLLMKLQHEETQLVSIEVRLVKERKLQRHQRRKYKQVQKKIFDLWDSFEAKEKTAKQLLKSCVDGVSPQARMIYQCDIDTIYCTYTIGLSIKCNNTLKYVSMKCNYEFYDHASNTNIFAANWNDFSCC